MTNKQEINNLISKVKQKKTAITNRELTTLQRKIKLLQEKITPERLHAVGEYEIITSEDSLKEIIQLIKKDNHVSFDIETTGLDNFTDKVVGVCLYSPSIKPCYVPCNHVDVFNGFKRIEPQITEDTLKVYIKDLLENVGIIGHNLKFDLHFMTYQWGVNINKVNIMFDTLLGGFILNENEPNHKLKYLYDKYILKNTDKVEDFSTLFEGMRFDYIPLEIGGVYASNDAIKTYELYLFQKQFLKIDHERKDFRQLAHILFDIEIPLIKPLILMEQRGVEIREDFAQELSKELNKELQEILDKLNNFLNIEVVQEEIEKHEELKRIMKNGGFNWSSPTQIAILIYDILHLTPPSKKKERSTDEKTIQYFINTIKTPEINELFQNLLKYRNRTKLLTTYVEKIPQAKNTSTNAVHTQFNQIGAKTGRFSSSHPVYKINLQNIPSHEKRVRKMFKAREGYYLVSCDFSQIEPRVLASLSGDENMLSAYKEGRDLYAEMASKIFNMPVSECKEFRADGTVNAEGKERRSATKAVLLGIMYERSAEDIAKEFNKPVKWGYEIVEMFKKAYPKIETTRIQVINQAELLGYVNTIDGRKRRLPDMQLTNKEDYRYQQAHRQCLNAVIQGTSADIMKKAIIKLHNSKFYELGGYILMTIHDELICEVPKTNAKECIEIIKQCMCDAGKETTGINMKVDAEVTEIWYGETIDL